MDLLNTLIDNAGLDIDEGDFVLYFPAEEQLIKWFEDYNRHKKYIFRVIARYYDMYELKGIPYGNNRTFSTQNGVCLINLKHVPLSILENEKFVSQAQYAQYKNMICEEEAIPILRSKETTKMNANINRLMNRNTESAAYAAKVTAGKTLNKVVLDKVNPNLPILLRGYANTPIGAVVLSNVVSFIVQNFASNNAKAKYAAEAMMDAAMIEFMDSFNIEALISDVLSGVLPENVEIEKVAE